MKSYCLNAPLRVFVIVAVLASHLTSFGQQPSDSVAVVKTSPLAIQSHKKTNLIRSIIFPTTLIVAGATVIHNDEDGDDWLGKYKIRHRRNERMINFHTRIDDYLQYAPVAAVYGLNLAGLKGKNDFANRTALLIKSEAIMVAITFSLKKITAEPRPDSGKPNSFPSGHTAQAFMAATFLSKEYRDKSIWYPVAAYTLATSVGVLRVLNDRHWANDVLAGAGVGILSANLAYATHRYKWGKSRKKNKTASMMAFPTYSSGPGLYVMCRL